MTPYAAQLLLVLLTGGAPDVEIIAHRGASRDAPENTTVAMRLAWEQGADASEFDVRLSRDGRAVVIHDVDTRKVAGVAGLVADRSLAELRALDVGAWKEDRFTGERMPTLSEMLAATAAGKRAFVEIKCGPEVVPELDQALGASGLPPERTPVISFNRAVVAAVKAARPDLPVYWLVSLKPEEGKRVPTADELIAVARDIGADGLDVSAHDALTAEFAQRVKAAGLKIYVYTVNDADVAARLAGYGVDGITTDRPGWLRERLTGDE